MAIAALALRERAEACGGDWTTVADVTTFDPSILADTPEGLHYDPYTRGWGGNCDHACAARAILADWRGYLKDTGVADAAWERVLMKAPQTELSLLRASLDGKAAVPQAYESLARVVPAHREKVKSSLAFVELARTVEPLADLTGGAGRPSPTLLDEARKGLAAAAKDPFLAQRYAFQIMRITFYQRDWAGVVTYFDRNIATLATPSTSLLHQARYYLAGALARAKQIPRANLELARIHASYPPLAGAAAEDFKPRNDADWNDSLRLARDAREKLQLWRLAGLTKDGIAAMQEMLKIDPKSNLYALLVVRELNRAESMGQPSYGPPDPKDVAARKKALTTLAGIAHKLVATPGADSVWLMQLVLGHIAAKSGDLATARTHLTAAAAARPRDPKVAAQVRASLALAHAHDWKFTNEADIAIAMNALDKDFGRLATVRIEVRDELARAYAKAGKHIDAEFLRRSEPDDEVASRKRWADVAFLRDMIARTTRTATDFDRFVLDGSHTRPNLERELAARHLVDGDLAAAHKVFSTTTATSTRLGTDPFAMRTVDCHDCDHEKFKSSSATHASVAARLVDLELKAKAGGEAGAEAALALGNALYNLTWFGNARVFLGDTHAGRWRDTRAAERWYKLAHDLSRNRELKVRAAFFAAKAELGQLVGENEGMDPLPIPSRWFPIVKSYGDTKYLKEIIAECGHYADWAGVPPKPAVRKHP